MNRRAFLTLPVLAATQQPQPKPVGWVLVTHGGYMQIYPDKPDMEVLWHHQNMPGYKPVMTTEEYVKAMLKWYYSSYKEAFPVYK